MEAWRGAVAPGRTGVAIGMKTGAMALAVAMALGLSGCGGGGGGSGNVRPTTPSPPPAGGNTFTGKVDVDANGAVVMSENLGGPIDLVKGGAGALTLTGTNAYTGITQVNAGALYVNGDQSAAKGDTTVASGATLGGRGTVGGDVKVADGATLSPGDRGAIGTLTINGNLFLSAGSALEFGFDPVAGTTQIGDLVNVKGNLTLDGVLSIGVPSGGDLGPGVHRLFNYGGTLVDNGLTLGNMPSAGWAVQTGVAHEINLVDTRGLVFSYWDGDAGPKSNNSIDGGNGTWTASTSTSNWTDANGSINTAYGNGSFAIFQGAAGTVTVDDAKGQVDASGMQFATYDYLVQGDPIHLVGSTQDPTHSVVRVGDGSRAGARYRATVGSVLMGDTALVKTDTGTLVLSGDNTYTGGTTVSGGTLQIGDGGTTGSIQGDVTNNGSLAFSRSDDVTFGGVVSGSGKLVQAGTGTLTLTGSNTYTGGTLVQSGILEVVSGMALGTGDITVSNDRFDPASTLKVNQGISLSNHVMLQGYGTLDNAGSLGGNVEVAVEGSEAYFRTDPTVMNHDGGTIRGNRAGIFFAGSPGTIKNSSGGLIEGGDFGIDLTWDTQVGNDGVGSIIRSSNGIAVRSLQSGSVRNTNGGTILGGAGAIQFGYGGGVVNDGAGSSVLSTSGNAVRITQSVGSVSNTGGATISSHATALYLEHGGFVTNGAGSTIESTGGRAGDCGGAGDCAIYVASDSYVPGSSTGGEVRLNNAGTIIGNVQLIPTAWNDVTLVAGGSIRGDLTIGTSVLSGLALGGDPGTVQLYSQAVTGRTTFSAGALSAGSSGTWIIDTDDLRPGYLSISTGTLQIGNGGTTGSLGDVPRVDLYTGNMVFNRSDDVTFDGSIYGSHVEGRVGTLVQAGTGKLTLEQGSDLASVRIRIDRGILQIGNDAGMPGGDTQRYYLGSVSNQGALVFNATNASVGTISGSGSVRQDGPGTLRLEGQNTYTGGTTIDAGSVRSAYVLPGDVTVNQAGVLSGPDVGLYPGFPGVAGHLTNAGKIAVRGGDSIVGVDFSQSSTGSLLVNLGSKLSVGGTATLGGGALEITGADSGYVGNAHTEVLTAAGGVTGTFDSLVKDTGVVFTSSVINYTGNSVWLDTTGLNVTTAAAGNGITYTPSSFSSAQRVQSAFTQLNSAMATGGSSGATNDFVQAAGQFQQAPTLQAAQDSLQSLSGELYAASAAMTFEAIDASSRALAGRFDDLLGKRTGYGAWTQNLNVGGDMGRAGYNGVGFQLNGWLVGQDRQIGSSGVAGFAFGQSEGRQQLDRSYDHNRSRGTEGMFYAGWLDGNWYTQGRLGFGHFRQNVDRRLLLGMSAQDVSSDYSGTYNVAYGETGLRLDVAGSRVVPFLNVEYASIDHRGFAEQGAGGFGLRTDAQTLDRWQAGVGLRASRHWEFGGDRSLELNAGAQFQRTIASHGDVFNASFVGLQQWQPLVGIGMSRYRGVVTVGLNATLSKNTSLKFGYDYQSGQRDQAQMVSGRLVVAL